MHAMVLCAGLGTRLRPLTETWPKPALPLLGAPLLRAALAVLKAGGVSAVGVNTHHLPEVMRAVAEAECRRVGLPLAVAHEPELQGTGGGIRGLRAFLQQSDPFVVFNGDILFPLDVASVVAEHRARQAAASLVLMPMPEGDSYAAVECDAGGSVRRIAGHGPGGEGLSPWHFTGVHVMSPRVFDFMSPAGSGPEDINRDVYPRMLAAGQRIHGGVVRGYWSDLGTPARYLQTVEDLLAVPARLSTLGQGSPLAEAREHERRVWTREGTRPPADVEGPAFIEDGAEIAPGAKVGPLVHLGRATAVATGARVTRSALLEGARVTAGESLDRVIAWPGGQLRG